MKPHLQVSGAIFIQNGLLFAARRGDSRYAYVAHKYEFVGGKIEAGESPEQALLRELQEEMGLQADIVAPYRTLTHSYPDFDITLHTFVCRMRSGYKLLEHESARWLPIAQLNPDQWAPADAPIIKQIIMDGGTVPQGE